MFIPVNTDAPIYHRPLGTIGLIVANICSFVLTSAGLSSDGWRLTFGQGLHPTEWLASAFLHFGPMHLIGNMIFLWAFGLIIEGKLGTLRFLSLYAVMCLASGCLVQTLMLAGQREGGAGGASGVIFAMMVIALLWAPHNTFTVFVPYRPMFYMLSGSQFFEMRVLTFACLYLGLNLLYATMAGFAISTPVLHLLGAAVGLPFGLLFLKYNWVDCEGWDLFTRWKEDRRTPDPTSLFAQPKSSRDRDPQVIERAVRASPAELAAKFRSLVNNQQYQAAARAQLELHRAGGRFSPTDIAPLRRCINGLKSLGLSQETADMIRDAYLPLHPSDAPRARLMLAEILVKQSQQPRAALRALEPLDPATLPPDHARLLERLRQLAEEQIESGVMEILVEDR